MAEKAARRWISLVVMRGKIGMIAGPCNQSFIEVSQNGKPVFAVGSVTRMTYTAIVSSTVHIEMPESMVLKARNQEDLALRARFLLGLKLFELGELSSGQAAAMAGMPRVVFLFEAGRHGVPVADIDSSEVADEFRS